MTAYDCMDTVSITLRLSETAEPLSEVHMQQTSWGTTIPSTGEDDPVEWLRAALIGMLEAL